MSDAAASHGPFIPRRLVLGTNHHTRSKRSRKVVCYVRTNYTQAGTLIGITCLWYRQRNNQKKKRNKVATHGDRSESLTRKARAKVRALAVENPNKLWRLHNHLEQSEQMEL